MLASTAITEVVPASITEQLAVVAAFIIFLVGVWAFLKWVLGWAKSIITEQRTEWQAFMDRENDKTRTWLNDQECNNRAAIERSAEASRKMLGQVSEGLEALIDQTRALTEQITQQHNTATQQLAKHDEKVDNKFNEAVKTITNGNGNKIPERRKASRA